MVLSFPKKPVWVYPAFFPTSNLKRTLPGGTFLFPGILAEKRPTWGYSLCSRLFYKKIDDHVGQQEVGESGVGVVWLWSVGV